MKSFTKKISLLVMLSLCLTVGGVYAAWQYAADAGVEELVDKAVNLTPVSQSGSLGTYEVLYQDFSILIDQTAEGDYTPKLSLYPAADKNGDLVLKFTPNNVASDELKTNALESYVTFSSSLQHDGTPIFSFAPTFKIGKVGGSETYNWVKDGTFFTCTIPNADLKEIITLNYTEKLDTYAKYQAFQASLGKGTVSIKIANTEASGS